MQGFLMITFIVVEAEIEEFCFIVSVNVNEQSSAYEGSVEEIIKTFGELELQLKGGVVNAAPLFVKEN